MLESNRIPYTQEIKDFILIRIKEEENSAKIAREVISIFNFNYPEYTIGRQINRMRLKNNEHSGKRSERSPRKTRRLFWDIETSPCLGWFWRPSYKAVILPHQIIEYAKIMCISYKWEGEDVVHNLRWDTSQCDKQMLIDFIDIINHADESIAHNGDRFDEKWLRTRCIYHKIPAFPKYKTLDTLKKAKSGFNFPSNKLDEIGKYLGVGRKIQTNPELWEKVWQNNDREALQEMVDYCDQDVLLLEDVYNALSPYITDNTNLTVLNGGKKYHCSTCASKNVELSKTVTTAMGTVQRWMKCNDCSNQYKITNKAYMNLCEDRMRE